ncbi:MAG: hypothetical protein HRT47_12340 [Candidatus Caenarcaniphilales bacterium]|nr:hypothetical protein [Candidatus Caenarcaniphilales bacterium]
MDIETLNLKLKSYDDRVFQDLEPVLEEISKNSKALASNLKSCFTEIALSDRYLRAYNGEEVAIKEKELKEGEFMIFRKYVRLLRSCTIMCGGELSDRYKKLFIDFFMGERLSLAREFKS